MKLILTISMVVEVELPVAIWVCLAAGHIQPHLHMPWCHSLGIKNGTHFRLCGTPKVVHEPNRQD